MTGKKMRNSSLGTRRSVGSAILGVLLLAILVLLGCVGELPVAPETGTSCAGDVLESCESTSRTARDGFWGEVRPNLLPDTWLLDHPPSQNPEGGYVVRMQWYGWDPDGYIDHFEYRAAGDGVFSDWVSVIASDTLLFIGADVTLAWQLAVRSVDDQGEADPSPAKYTFFIPDDGKPVHR